MTLSDMHREAAAYCGKRVLVTGAAGFVGGHLLDELGKSTAEVAVVTREICHSSKVQQTFVGDMREQDFVRRAIQEWKPDFIFHLAGARDRSLTRDAFDNAFGVNLVGALNLFFAALEIPSLQRIVILGTAEEYGGGPAPFVESMRESPISAYSLSKQCATHLSQLMHCSLGLPVVVLRPSIAYGPAQRNDMFLPALIQALSQGKEFPMTPGEQTRDYIYVADLVGALLRAGHYPGAAGEIINIGSGEPIQIAQLVNRVEDLLGCPGLARRGVLAYRIGEQMAYWLDISKAKRLLDWKPRTSLEEGLGNTIAWYQERRE